MIELNKIYNEPCLETMKRMDNESIDCVITSPPYWQLRDYGYDGQWGLEPTYQEYLEHLWLMMDEVWRVLKPTGTVWINLGDTYSGSNGAGSLMTKWNGLYSGESLRVKSGRRDFIASKSLLLLPHRFAIGCMDRGWIVRNDIIWAKRNGMPESVRDRFSKKHEYMFFMVKQEKYYFDLDAVKEPSSTYQNDKRCSAIERARMLGYDSKIQYGGKSTKTSMFLASQPMKNPGSVSDFWDIPTKPSSDKHFAMYNDALITKPILAGCPEYVCNKCGKPRKKKYSYERTPTRKDPPNSKFGSEEDDVRGGNELRQRMLLESRFEGWIDCNCNAGYRPGIIYDPFAGTGTTIACTMRAKRYGIGSEMSKEFCNIFERNISEIRDQVSLI